MILKESWQISILMEFGKILYLLILSFLPFAIGEDGEQWSKEMIDHKRAGGQFLQNSAKKLLQSLRSNSIGDLQTSQNSNG